MNRYVSWALLSLAVCIGEVRSADRYVSPAGHNVYPFTDWWGAATNIYWGISAAGSGDTVWVDDGTYDLSSAISLTLPITLQSVNGPSTTILDGGYPARTNRCVSIAVAGAVVDGFTISNGRPSTDIASGGGVKLIGGTLRNSIVTGCGNVSPGGGNGGGVYCQNGTIERVVIRLNGYWTTSGGGIYLNGGLVDRCVVDGNITGGDGGGVHIVSGTVRNTLVINNQASSGGGIRSPVGSAVENCTVYSNSASVGAGGIFPAANGGTVVNTIIWSNRATVRFPDLQINATNKVTYSCSPTLYEGVGNITNAPLFLNSGAGDFRLAEDSPCIDIGLNQPWMKGVPDLEGHSRIVNGTVDMGAYEFPSEALSITVASLDIGWLALTGVTYQLQWCSTLTSPAWSNLGSAIVGTGHVVYTNEVIRDLPSRVYRVIRQQ